MAPFFRGSTSPLDAPSNLFRLNATTEPYYHGVDCVVYQYSPDLWAAHSRQSHIDQHLNNCMVGVRPIPSNPPALLSTLAASTCALGSTTSPAQVRKGIPILT